MATRAELVIASQKDFEKLYEGWRELFMSEANDDGGVSLKEDRDHPPAALGQMLNEQINFTMVIVGEEIDKHPHKYDAEAQITMLMDSMINLVKIVGVRMYRLGQHLNSELPYGDLTPCPHRVIADDELEAFLSKAEGADN